MGVPDSSTGPRNLLASWSRLRLGSAANSAHTPDGVRTFGMLGQVQSPGFIFRADPQADGEVDGLGEQPGHREREDYGHDCS